MNIFIHIDKIWFRLTSEKSNVDATANETTLQQTARSKNFIPQVVFLCVVARPTYGYTKNIFFWCQNRNLNIRKMRSSSKQLSKTTAETLEM